MSLYLSGLRKEYRRERLDEATAAADPLSMFEEWFAEAAESGLVEPNAMTLATATPEGKPSARVVLLKDFDPRGFSFFTNYASRKGQEIAANPFAALTFWWGPLERQIRIEGRVEKLDADESDAYFASRPQGSRLGAWVSHQSAVIPDRAVLEARLADLEAQYGDGHPWVLMTQADLERALAPVAIADAPQREQEPREHQRVAVDDPLELTGVGVQLAAQRGQRDVHDRVVDDDHEDAEAQHPEDRPPPVVHSLRCHAHVILLVRPPGGGAYLWNTVP